MKQFRVAIATAITAIIAVPCWAGDARESINPRRILKYCDPVCELQAQDSAYSLLIEAYRQFQSYQIQTDYEQRLKSAAALSGERGAMIIQADLQGVRTFRNFVEDLARQERELRMEQLQQRVSNFHTAYGCARRVDEEEIGEAVAKRVDPKGAGAKLKSYFIVALGSPATADYKLAKASPASKIFLDSAPVMIPPERLIQSCE